MIIQEQDLKVKLLEYRNRVHA